MKLTYGKSEFGGYVTLTTWVVNFLIDNSSITITLTYIIVTQIIMDIIKATYIKFKWGYLQETGEKMDTKHQTLSNMQA